MVSEGRSQRHATRGPFGLESRAGRHHNGRHEGSASGWNLLQLKYGLISVDDHVQEPPDLWTRRLANGGWGNRVPHIEQADDGAERWVADGRVLLHGRVAS